MLTPSACRRKERPEQCLLVQVGVVLPERSLYCFLPSWQPPEMANSLERFGVILWESFPDPWC